MRQPGAGQEIRKIPGGEATSSLTRAGKFRLRMSPRSKASARLSINCALWALSSITGCPMLFYSARICRGRQNSYTARKRSQRRCCARSGPLFLSRPEVANLMVRALLDGERLGRYRLHAFVVMPNHVHLPVTGNCSAMDGTVEGLYWPCGQSTTRPRRRVLAGRELRSPGARRQIVRPDSALHRVEPCQSGIGGNTARKSGSPKGLTPHVAYLS